MGSGLKLFVFLLFGSLESRKDDVIFLGVDLRLAFLTDISGTVEVEFEDIFELIYLIEFEGDLFIFLCDLELFMCDDFIFLSDLLFVVVHKL